MAIPELLDEVLDTNWGEPSSWDLTNIRRMLQRMLQLRRSTAQVDSLRKKVNEQYQEEVAKLQGEYNDLRAQVQDWLVRFNGGEKVRLPDLGTAYLQGKDAQPKMVLASQEAAVTEIGTWAAERQDAVYKPRVFDPQAYLLLQQETVQAVLAGAAVDEAGVVRLTEDGTGVVQKTGEVVQLPPGVVLQRSDPVLAFRPA